MPPFLPRLPFPFAYTVTAVIALVAIVMTTAAMVVVTGNGREVVLGEYATSLIGRTPNQIENMRCASMALDGVTLAPGAVFSFARALGPVSAATGYRPALAIRDGEATREDGGGICQVSSTLYNAALRANLGIVERQRHLWPVHSVPPGLDAAFASGHIDLKLRNTLDQPVRIRATVCGSRLTFAVVGQRPLAERVRVERHVKAVIPPEQVVQATDRLRRGERRIVERGRPGFEVEAWRIVTEGGRELTRERLSADRYAPVHRVVWVGFVNEEHGRPHRAHRRLGGGVARRARHPRRRLAGAREPPR
jgi:vancomycin resistance protein YoaR